MKFIPYRLYSVHKLARPKMTLLNDENFQARFFNRQ